MLPFKRLTLPVLVAAVLASNPVAWAETPPPAVAEEAPAAPSAEMPPAAPPAEMPTAEPLFGLEYKIGADQPHTVEVFENDPFGPLLEIVKQTADSASKSKIKPARLSTMVKMLLPEDAAKELGDLPPMKMDTTVQGDGSGKSVFEMPAYQKEITEKGEEGRIHWQGFNGEISYKDPQLSSPAGQIKFPGLQVQVDAEKVDLQFKNLLVGAALDADWMPRKLELSLPEFTMKSPDGDMALTNLAFQGEVQEARPGLDVGKGGFKIGDFSFKSETDNIEFRIEGLNLSGESKLAGEVVNSVLNLGLTKLFAAGEMIPEDSNEYSYDSTLELRNVDAVAMAELQKTVRELQKQQREGMISEEMMGLAAMGIVMQNLPKFWQKSPEFALTKLNLKTKQGDIAGTANIKIDGTQKLDMENEVAMKNAVSGSAEFTIAKGILTKIFDMQIRESLKDMASAPAPETQPEQPPAGQPGAAPAQPPAPPSEAQIAQMVDAQIQALVAQKWLAPAGADSFKLSAQFQQGKLIVNGQPMEIPM